MEEYLDSDLFESLPEPPARGKSIFFVEFQRKSEVKLNTNDSITDYLSPTQCSKLKQHIRLVIEGGITDQAQPSIVNGHQIPPSFSVIHALKDGFNIVMFSNTHNNQKNGYTIHQSMGIRLILPYGMSLLWNGFLLYCGGRS